MILSGPTIRRLGIITPHEPRTRHDGMTYGESLAGYDIRLAEDVEVIQGYTTLGVSLERFTMPPNVLGRVADKSTWARRGLQVQNTIIEPGWDGWLTLELTYAPLVTAAGRGIRITAGSPIAQVIFEFVDELTAGYSGKYQNAGPASPSRSTPDGVVKTGPSMIRRSVFSGITTRQGRGGSGLWWPTASHGEHKDETAQDDPRGDQGATAIVGPWRNGLEGDGA